MHSSTLLPCNPTPPAVSSITSTRNPHPKPLRFYTPITTRKARNDSYLTTCKASTSSSSSSMVGLDLYDLLGVDSSSDQTQIKSAYRALQKRCHPDIAGPPGHEMAIILNDTYSLLSDPGSRSAYDREQAKVSELRGYTGKPLYSVWFGAESEERAVFVDEVKCVGCLKCALLAEKTFAVETVYGRARVVAQWADPENKVQEAIDACPVDCISIVERSNLAALEFLMSKQPRGSVRIGAGNTVGTRVSNIFIDVEKFQARFQEARDKASTKQSMESESERDARSSAIQAIRSISNWLYWKSPIAGRHTSETEGKLTLTGRRSSEPNIKKLQEAAAARKNARDNAKPISRISAYNDAYWIPSSLALPQATRNVSEFGAAANSPAENVDNPIEEEEFTVRKVNKRSPLVQGFPMTAATIAAVIVRLELYGVSGKLEEHMGGSLALGVVNNSWSPVILAGITWYLIGSYLVGLVEAIWDKLGMYQK
ncbi:chaperone protein dnaJ C76, chloroplastic [Rhododendron vialii]|uniref:chaperone protein dnaJ C76, chloroplastic n=1 Tax=Rhododendron vialii TaxID=182163 RepID=UPI00265D6878|nr:chaperone protein dnaJ C76, chloroplastic [Rhododendron vialii]